MIIAHAFRACELGISPIPLFPRTKIPAIPHWKPYVEQIPPIPLIKHWFGGKEEKNLGLVLRGNYVVVDFDDVGSFMVWNQYHETLSQTYTVRTSRGFHLYYESDERPESTLAFRNGELKASGYVVAPPSVHPSGKLYEVVKAMGILRVDTWQDLDLRDVVIEPKRSPLRSSSPVDSVCARIKEQLPIETYLNQITKIFPLRDGRYKAHCPFHDDKHPSMIVDLDYAYCFNPQCRGHRQLDVINCYALWERLGLREAIAELARLLLD